VSMLQPVMMHAVASDDARMSHADNMGLYMCGGWVCKWSCSTWQMNEEDVHRMAMNDEDVHRAAMNDDWPMNGENIHCMAVRSSSVVTIV
jgi:hypothetical protein